MSDLIKLIETLKEYQGKWFTADEIGRKMDVKTIEAEKGLWHLEQAGVIFKRRYELRNTRNNAIKVLEDTHSGKEADKLYAYFKFLDTDNFEIIEYFRFDN